MPVDGCGWPHPHHAGWRPWSAPTRSGCVIVVVAITVYLADDSVLIREGVRAMLERDRDVEVVGVAEDYDSLVAAPETAHPDVVVTDIRMPPNFQREGIDAAKEIRKRHPGTGDGDPQPVRRSRLRGRAAVGGIGRLRLPLEGSHRRG